jgi:hypothetical protein
MTDVDKVIEEARAEVLPFESWERLTGESSAAFAAFGVFRDFGAERSLKKAVVRHEGDSGKTAKRYRTWRSWSMRFHWFQRAADYDRYLDHLKLAKRREGVEAFEEKQGKIADAMLDRVDKKVGLMGPEDLSAGMAVTWLDAASRSKREQLGIETGTNGKNGQQELPGLITFAPEFEGL